MDNMEMENAKLDMEELEKIAGGKLSEKQLAGLAFEVWRDKMIAKYGNDIQMRMNSEERKTYDYLSSKNKWHMMHG